MVVIKIVYKTTLTNSYYEKMADGTVRCIDSEIPFEIPESWEWVRLKTIGITETGTTPSKEHPEYFGNFIPFLGPSNIQNNTIASVSQGLSEEGMTHGRIVPPNTILQVCIGGSIGKCAIVNKPVSFNQQINSVTPILCNTNYIFYNLQSDMFKTQIIESSTGTATPIINRSNWESILIPIPPLEEQSRITIKVEMLQPHFAKFDAAEKQLTSLNVALNQVLKKSVLQEAIQGRLVPQIESEGTAEELLEKIRAEKKRLVKEGKLKKSVLANESRIFRGEDNRYYENINGKINCIDSNIPFDVPASWSWSRIGSILNIWSARRVHEKDWRSKGIPFYRAREIGKLADFGSVDNDLFIDKSLYDEFSKSGVPHIGDLMMTAVGTLGKTYIVETDTPFYYKDGSVLCIGNSYGLNPYYLRLIFDSNAFLNQYISESDGTTVATLTMVRLNKYFLPIPPLKEQERIVNNYNAVAGIMSRQEKGLPK